MSYLNDLTPDEIYEMRQSLKISRAEFANYIGVRERTVLRWEHGKSKPSKLALMRLNTLIKKGKG